MVTLIRNFGKCVAVLMLSVLCVYIMFVQIPEQRLPDNNDLGSAVVPVQAKDWGAKLPSYNNTQNITGTDWWKSAAFIEWDLRHRPVDYYCRRYRPVGNWWICLDKAYAIKPPCLVYSFGIAYDFSFDDAMAKFGCEVHSFDPSMKMREHIRNTSVHFHPIGLSHEDIGNFLPRKDMYVKDNSTWKVMTLQSIMLGLGHQKKKLDVLKIDVEGYEWKILEQLLNSESFKNIKQFMLEYHLFPKWPVRAEYPKLLKIYKTLHDIGLQKFVTALHPLNHKPKEFNIQADVAYINKNFKSKITK